MWFCVFCHEIMLTFPSNNQVTCGGGSPVMLTSSVRVRPTFTTRFCKFVRSIFGFTGKEKLYLLILTQCEIPYTIYKNTCSEAVQ